MMKRIILSALIMLIPSVSLAATGDVLWQCDFSASTNPTTAINSCTGASAGGVTGMTVPQTGGQNNGAYLLLTHTGSVDSSQWDWSVDFANKQEITYVWYEKFSKSNIANSNVKSLRPYATNGNYFGAVIGQHWGNWYMSTWSPNGTTANLFTPNWTYVNSVRTYASPDYCQSNGDGTYSCHHQMSFNWDISGVDWGDTTWRKFRMYVKNPSSDTAEDGAITLWIDENQVFTFTNIRSSVSDCTYNVGGYLQSSVDFFPSEAGTEAFTHAYDDIVIYEGYVPPGDTPATPSPGLTGVTTSGCTIR